MSGATDGRIPLGYRFAAGHAGIRNGSADDLALMVSDAPAAAAAVFTRNAVRAAPVTVSARHLKASGGIARAIAANAGNANCAAPNMAAVAEGAAQAVCALVEVRPEQILLASTGVIGEPIDEKAIPRALSGLWRGLAPERFEDCARAILTTDTTHKTAYARLDAGAGAAVRIAGMAKGAGMIMPDMATMLSFLFTDAAVAPDALQGMLQKAVERSFNCISVDADTSTNDTVYLLANGASGASIAAERQGAFQQALDGVALSLALAIVRDGEGARKLVRIDVEGAADDRGAKRIAVSIANSPLVKTAIAGADPTGGASFPPPASPAPPSIRRRSISRSTEPRFAPEGCAPRSKKRPFRKRWKRPNRRSASASTAGAGARRVSGPAISPRNTSASTRSTAPETTSRARAAWAALPELL